MPGLDIAGPLRRWAALVHRHALLIVVLAVALAAAGGYYASSHLVVKTSTEDMLSHDLPFLKIKRQFDAAFPDLDGNLVVLLTAKTADQAEDAGQALAAALAQRSDLYRWVYYPQGDKFLRRNGLLFLDEGELETLSERVAQAEPLLGVLAGDMSLRGLAKVLGLASDAVADGHDELGGFDRALSGIADSVEGELAGKPAPLSWRALMSPTPLKPDDFRQVMLVQVNAAADAATALAAVPEIAGKLGLDAAHGVSVQLTGDLPIGADEVSAVTEGGERAGVISLALVSLIALVGVRSLRLVAAMIATLVISLVWTTAFAALAIDHLNLLSAAFAVLFIGIAMDFSVQFALRFQEARNDGEEQGPALGEAVSGTGVAIALAAFAAAVGFFSFVPTEYRGLAELGIISAAGMFIGFFATLTLLPAFFVLLPIPKRAPRASEERAERPGHFIVRYARPIGIGALLLGLLSLATIPLVGFEVDPIKLQNPDSESLKSYTALMADSRASPYSVSILMPSLAAADALKERLSKLRLVGDIVTLSSFVPENQAKKLDIIEQMSLFLLPVFGHGDAAAPPSLPERKTAVAALAGSLERLAAAPKAAALAAPAARLAALLRRFIAAAGDSAERYAALEKALLGNLPGQLASLELATGAGKVTLADLPEEIRSRYVSADGRARIEVSPKEAFAGTRQLRRFVDSIRAIAPEATGTAVLILDGADAVVHAFETSGVLAFIGVSLVLILVLRSVVDWLLVALPLALALSFTIATIVLLDTKLNLSNIMALPLLFSLGSAFGVYLVMRHREVMSVARLMNSSTPLAVLVSALTTMASFGSLMVSSHRGMASMGELLAISLLMALATNLIVLPALLAWRERRAA